MAIQMDLQKLVPVWRVQTDSEFFIVINVYMAMQIARIHVLLNNLLGHVDFIVA